jgi:hypothetical protein
MSFAPPRSAPLRCAVCPVKVRLAKICPEGVKTRSIGVTGGKVR